MADPESGSPGTGPAARSAAYPDLDSRPAAQRICARSSLVRVASGMLVAFAAQILLDGLTVVLYGILRARRRFTAPALAPVPSSAVMIAARGLFVRPGRRYTTHVTGLPLSAELTLPIGTTAGVAVQVAAALVPAVRRRALS